MFVIYSTLKLIGRLRRILHFMDDIVLRFRDIPYNFVILWQVFFEINFYTAIISKTPVPICTCSIKNKYYLFCCSDTIICQLTICFFLVWGCPDDENNLVGVGEGNLKNAYRPNAV